MGLTCSWPDGSPVAIETHVHLFSEHVQAALGSGWPLAEMQGQIVDERWIALKPAWAALRDVPVGFAAVWRRVADPGRSPSKGLDKPAAQRE
jgi:hypothetical protein